VLLLATYLLVLLAQPGIVALAGCLFLLGAHYAATDGVLMALGSGVLPPPLVATGLSLLTTATALMRFAGAVTFGALWGWNGPEWAFVTFAVALLLALGAAATLLPRSAQVVPA
jgi:hypothetical protein